VLGRQHCASGRKSSVTGLGRTALRAASANTDPNALIAIDATPLPIEVVVRARLTGSTSTAVLPRYLAGERLMYGHQFPDGLTPHGPLPQPIITPEHPAQQRIEANLADLLK